MNEKRSRHELIRLVDNAVTEVCNLPRPGFWFCVNNVESSGHPPEVLRVWATLHFLTAGSPFYCGEPNCHLGLIGDRLDEVSEHVGRAMGLEQTVRVEFGDRIGVQYQSGVSFRQPTDTDSESHR